MNIRMRAYGYEIATVLLVLILVWAGSHTWRELRQLHRSFASVQADDYYIPVQIDATLRELNEAVLRVDLRNNPGDRAAFWKGSQQLGQWIGVRQGLLTTPEQRLLLSRIKIAFDRYVQQSTQLMDERSQNHPTAGSAPALTRMEAYAAPVQALCDKLKESERAEQTQFIKESQRALVWIQQLIAWVFMVLVIMAGTGIVALYTGVIGPLRVELNQSRVLAMRNEKLASLGTLAAGVAHEIRNPLTAINVRLHSLKKQLVANSSEQEDALVIDHEIQRLERIVQEFLQFARPADPKFVIVSADSLFAKVVSLFASQLEKSAIELKVESLPDIWVRVDPAQIEQVLINLVKNSAESVEHDGTITLRVRTTAARLSGRNQPVVILEVSDTGKGISDEVQKHIFDPFFTTKEQGTGLGLVIAARIVEKHNGALQCRSVLNRGTTFAILLPQPEPEKMNESPP